ncbi:MAG TPA: molecular chaperone DnaJ [Polyangiaceae bacterium]|jgi:molecular chaperone DnaJ|nr:molecular chaperone DnaJ [Polyangiaceae bacterium]
MKKRDYYEVLGISREASDDEIRRAYKQCALKHHPDRNQGDAAAEQKFKEATEAYAILNDKEKRPIYDRFGHAGLEGRGGFDFQGAGVADVLSHFQDLFSDFFGGGGGGGFGGRQRGPARGSDVRVEATITLEEAMVGTKHEVNVEGAAPCEECGGTGARKGTKPQTCAQCGGAGQVGTQRGFVMFTTACARCRGTGQTIATPCDKCKGAGGVEKRRKVVVTFPAGIDSGQRLRVPGQGMPGPPGTKPGDLYVDVDIEAHASFERQGYDLITRHRISFPQAVLGTELSIAVPGGTTVSAKVAPGTQPGSVLTMHEKGVPHLDRGARGALHVVVEVDVPKRLSKNAKKLLEELESELSGNVKQAEAR